MADMHSIFIDKSDDYYPELSYIFTILFWHFGLRVEFVDDLSIAHCSVGPDDGFDLIYNREVLGAIVSGKNVADQFVENKGMFLLSQNRPDWIVSAFFMLTCAQEIGASNKDEFGRFMFRNSYQFKLGCGHIDKVAHCFEELSRAYPKLGLPREKSKGKRRIFLSHDIDLLYGSVLQDGFFCLKNTDFIGLSKVIARHLTGSPLWMNMRDLISVENEYEYSSTFFWLPVYGKSVLGVWNADYKMNDPKVKELVKFVNENGGESGLHKAISGTSFQDELSLIEGHVKSNRYHFLAFDPLKDFKKMEQAGIEFDSSVSFAEAPAYRAGYSRPYKPFILADRRMSSIVESPMHLMDTTFYNYLKLSPLQAKTAILDFVQFSDTSSVIGLLWHNNFYSPYKYRGYMNLYKELLSEFRNLDIETVNTMTLVKEVCYEL